MYTSNFAKLRVLEKDKSVRPVAISIGLPKWYTGPREIRLAPMWQMLKMPREDYDRLFWQHLNKLNAVEIYHSLGENAVLLCYEKHNDWCHRRMVAEWFEQQLGIVVPEYGFDRSETLPYRETGRPKKKDSEEDTENVNKKTDKAVDDGYVQGSLF